MLSFPRHARISPASDHVAWDTNRSFDERSGTRARRIGGSEQDVIIIIILLLFRAANSAEMFLLDFDYAYLLYVFRMSEIMREQFATLLFH